MESFNLIALILHSSWVVKCTLLVLLTCSLITWTLLFYKGKKYSRILKLDRTFLALYEKSSGLKEISENAQNYPFSPCFHLFSLGHKELQRLRSISATLNKTETIERALEKALAQSEEELRKGLSILATIASTAPFVGLLGTVWGIMDTFKLLGKAQESSSDMLSVVAPGIAEALVATAVGLFVAIPAVWFYNILLNKKQTVLEVAYNFKVDFLNLIERSFWAKGQGQIKE